MVTQGRCVGRCSGYRSRVDTAHQPDPAPGVLIFSQAHRASGVHADYEAIRNIALWLDDWDDRSIWGYDPQADGFFAQLWRNDEPDTDDDTPHIWITPAAGEDSATPGALARQIAMRTHCDLHEVCDAMNESAPSCVQVHAS